MRPRAFVGILLFLTYSIASFPSCKKPTILNPVATPDKTGRQFTVTWTTDVSSDSLVGYGNPNPGTFTEVSDTGGTTTHSVTVTGLFPSTQYGWGIRSQAVNNGVSCGTGYTAFYGGGTVTTSAPPSGAFTYEVVPVGPTYVTQGYGMYFQIRLLPMTGTYAPNSLTMVLSGLPEFTSIRWSDAQLWKEEPDVPSTTVIPNDTVSLYAFSFKEPYVETNVGGTTPPGNYTITITVSGQGGPTQVATWPLHVVPSSAPFSGIPLQLGQPTSYPPIPNLSTYLSSANTFGVQNCAQDMDASRTIRPNDLSRLTPVGSSTTYGSWFYDGVMVYYNVENLLNNGKNWAQCRDNVKQVYRDNYALIKPIQTYMMFSEGYYMDYLKIQDPADLELINKFNGETYAPFHGVYVDVSYLQREVAYVTRNETHGVALGQNVPYQGQTSAFMRDYAEDHVLGMIDQLCLSQNAQYFENFMAGLQAEALIQYYTLAVKDPRIPPALSCLADYLYNNQWQALNAGSFPYDKFQWHMQENYANGATSCMNTLNNLISPMYAWLFMMTGNSTYQVEGDVIFSHGVAFDCSPLPTGPAAYLTAPLDSDGKNFSQQYYWGARYVEWRSSTGSTGSGAEKVSEPVSPPTGLNVSVN